MAADAPLQSRLCRPRHHHLHSHVGAGDRAWRVNLGQGFPDEDGPLAIREAAARALIDGPNQYPPTRGLAARCARPSPRMPSASTDSISIRTTQVLVTSGATEALTASILGLVGPGDEVVLIEPAYDCYRPIARSRRRHGEDGRARAAATGG